MVEITLQEQPMNWIDVTRPLQQNLAGWPGDTPVLLEQRWSRARGDSVTVGKFQQSLHTGTHCDAPIHFLTDGPAAESLDPTLLCGPALVVDARGRELIELSELSQNQPCPRRVLLRTDAWPDSQKFPARIPVMSPDAICMLVEAGVQLIGVDLPSVDPLDSPLLANHHDLYRGGITILEGLDLTKIAPGRYEMLALPLLIPGADGAPVRALLRKRNEEVRNKE
jgi:arylformamidase